MLTFLSVLLKTGSNTADIKRFRSHTVKLLIHFISINSPPISLPSLWVIYDKHIKSELPLVSLSTIFGDTHTQSSCLHPLNTHTNTLSPELGRHMTHTHTSPSPERGETNDTHTHTQWQFSLVAALAANDTNYTVTFFYWLAALLVTRSDISYWSDF